MKAFVRSIQARIEKGLKPMDHPSFPDASDKEFWRAWRLVTFFGVGRIWIAPGTMGSMAGVVFMVAVMSFVQAVIGSMAAALTMVILTGLLFFYGARASDICMARLKEHDPGQIVIDEVVGVMLTIILSMLLLWVPEILLLGEVKQVFGEHMVTLVLIMFFSFRVMDVVKPWPVSLVDEKVKGGIGVMLDDVAAALFATLATIFIYGLLLSTSWKPL